MDVCFSYKHFGTISSEIKAMNKCVMEPDLQLMGNPELIASPAMSHGYSQRFCSRLWKLSLFFINALTSLMASFKNAGISLP